MGNVGWFILIYFAVGWILDAALTIFVMYIAKKKDQKNGDSNLHHQIGEEFDGAIEWSSEFFGGGDKGGFIAWLVTRFLWPISMPVGIYYILTILKGDQK